MTDPLARAVAGFHALPVPDRPADELVLARLTPVEPARPSTWRRVMTRTALFATAASVLAASLLLVGGSSVALADVVKAAEKHTLVKYTIAYREVHKAPEKLPPAEGTGTCYADLHASRMWCDEGVVTTLNGHVEMVGSTVIDWAADRTLYVRTETLVPNKPVEPFFQKTYDENAGRFPVRLAFLCRATLSDAEPSEDQQKPFLSRLREMADHPKATATKDPRYGPKVVRFHVADGVKTTDLWVDTTTTLPVRLYYEWTQAHTGNAYRWTHTDFAWDPKLPAGVKSVDELFSLVPPPGYIQTDETDKK